jgi:hypothetical protein
METWSEFLLGKCRFVETTLRFRYCDKHPSHNRFLVDLWKTGAAIELNPRRTSPLQR